jgi:hypothetical protein
MAIIVVATAVPAPEHRDEVKYASDEAVAAHRYGAGLAALIKALDGKLAAPMDVQILAPHPAGSPVKGAL